MSDTYPLARRQKKTALSTMQWATQDALAWNQLGVGGREWEFPVLPEPPFKPLFVDPPMIADDGRKPNAVAEGVKGLFRWLTNKPPEVAPPPSPEPAEDYHWLAFPDCGPPVEFQVLVPPKLNVTPKSIGQFLGNLRYCRLPLCLELIATHESISMQFAVNECDAEQVELQLKAFFPEIVFIRRAAHLERLWTGTGGVYPVFVDFGLRRSFVVPIMGSGELSIDPFIGLCGALSELKRGEAAVWQVLFERAQNDWAENILKFGEFVEEFAPQAQRKASGQLYAAVVRLAAQSFDEGRAWSIARNLASAMNAFDNTEGNGFVPLDNHAYTPEKHELDLLLRRTHRSGILLNADELLGLVHWPSPAVRVPALERVGRKTKAAPDITFDNPLILGTNTHNGEERIVTLNPAQRARHMHVIGASGTGKSTALLNMIVQDIESGAGLALLDPHGDLIEAVLARIPEERYSDVVLVDPADEEFPVGFNILSAHSNLEKNLLASDLVSVFQRLSTSWGDVMTSVLGNAILAFLESSRGGTLNDLRRFLLEPGYRSEFLETVQDAEVVYFWKKEFPLLTGRPHASLLTRLDAFLRPKPIRYMVGQKENRLDFASIMDSRKIFLAKLSQGLIGHENSQLLGALFVSKFHQLVMGRQETREAAREYFWLYIDEFQDFVTPSMATILGGARKYRLGLVLSHQDMQQIQSRDMDVNSAILANAYTRVCFRLGDSDARKMAEGFTTFDAKDLQDLGTGEAICRVERSAFDFNLTTAPVEPVDEEAAAARCRQIRLESRKRYSKPRAEVESVLQGDTKARLDSDSEAPPKRAAAEETESVEDSAAPGNQAAEPKQPGKGGTLHQAQQELIKQWAVELGQRPTIEKPLPNGEGSVDVDIQTGTESIACEISISSTKEYEIGNISKCLTAGYNHVLAICSDRGKRMKLAKSAADALPPDSLKRVHCLSLVEACMFLQGLRVIKKSNATGTGGWDVRIGKVLPVVGDTGQRVGTVDTVLKTAARRTRNKRDGSK